MNLRNRIIETLKGNHADKTPIFLKSFRSITSYDQIALISDHGKREIGERVFNLQHGFLDIPSGINRYLVTPKQYIKETGRKTVGGNVLITSRLITPGGDLTAVIGTNQITDTKWQVKYPVESLYDIEKIRSIPWEYPEGMNSPDISKLPSEFYERNLIKLVIDSPFVCVAGMMPYELFLILCATEFNLIKELTVLCHERIKKLLALHLKRNSIDYVLIRGCEWLTPPMGSPVLYEELVQPFEKELIKMSHEADAFIHVHCHGNVSSTIKLVMERGADLFEPVEPPPDGDITFAEARKLVSGRMVVGGNIEARKIENKGEDEIRKAVKEAFRGGKQHMVLMDSAPPVVRYTERIVKNYHAVIDLWEQLA